jgi:hypothetical protein
MPDEHRSAARVEGAVFGLLIMALGVALLLDRAGVVSLFGYSTFWPFLVIAFGLVKLSHRRDDGAREGGWWLFVGVWMLLNEMRVLRFRDSWPLLLVAIGISMAWKEVVRRRGTPRPKGPGLLEHERVE